MYRSKHTTLSRGKALSTLEVDRHRKPAPYQHAHISIQVAFCNDGLLPKQAE